MSALRVAGYVAVILRAVLEAGLQPHQARPCQQYDQGQQAVYVYWPYKHWTCQR